MSKKCFDCAYCSTYAYKPIDECDLDGHQILNVYVESCDNFIEAEDEDA